MKIGDRFNDPDAAGRDAVADINPQSIVENTEYGGTIEREVSQIENHDGTTIERIQYYATDAVAGKGDNFETTGRMNPPGYSGDSFV